METKTKICIVVKAFLEHPTYTIEELAELPEIKKIEISSENILAYLNNPMIIDLFDARTYNDIQNKLNQNLQKNVTTKHFEKPNSRLDGNLKAFSIKIITAKEQRKMDHIYTFTKIHLKHPKISFERIATLYNQNNVIGETVTADYVSECLMSKAYSNFFADNIWNYRPINLLDGQEAIKGEKIK